MKILITGGNGYLGKSLSNELKKKYDTTTITRSEVDLTNSTLVEKYFDDKYFDVVIHCAGSGVKRLDKNDWGVLDDNLMIFYSLLRVESHYGKFIYLGSGAEDYLDSEPYGFSKKVISKSIKNKSKFFNLKLFAVFDENELETRFIKANIKRYINAKPLVIHQNKLMDFFYMKDLVTLIEYYLHNTNLEKEVECVYPQKFYLTTIAEKINQLDNYRVEVKTELSKPAERYIGKYMIPYTNIEFLGLDFGIKETYKRLKEYEKN